MFVALVGGYPFLCLSPPRHVTRARITFVARSLSPMLFAQNSGELSFRAEDEVHQSGSFLARHVSPRSVQSTPRPLAGSTPRELAPGGAASAQVNCARTYPPSSTAESVDNDTTDNNQNFFSCLTHPDSNHVTTSSLSMKVAAMSLTSSVKLTQEWSRISPLLLDSVIMRSMRFG